MTKVEPISTRDQGQEYKRLTLAECHVVAVFPVSLIHTQSVFTWLNCFSYFSYKIRCACNALAKSHQAESKTCWRTSKFQTFIYLVLRHGKSGRRQQLLPFFPSLTLIGKFSLWKVLLLVTLTMKMRSVTKIPPSSAATSTPLRWSWQVWIHFSAFTLFLDWQLEMRGGSSPSLKRRRREFRLVKRRQSSFQKSEERSWRYYQKVNKFFK